MYEHYGTKSVDYVSEPEGGHGWTDPNVMVNGFKYIYSELGYVEDIDDFNEPTTDIEDYGSWLKFDQREFVELG